MTLLSHVLEAKQPANGEALKNNEHIWPEGGWSQLTVDQHQLQVAFWDEPTTLEPVAVLSLS